MNRRKSEPRKGQLIGDDMTVKLEVLGLVRKHTLTFSMSVKWIRHVL